MGTSEHSGHHLAPFFSTPFSCLSCTYEPHSNLFSLFRCCQTSPLPTSHVFPSSSFLSTFFLPSPPLPSRCLSMFNPARFLDLSEKERFILSGAGDCCVRIWVLSSGMMCRTNPSLLKPTTRKGAEIYLLKASSGTNKKTNKQKRKHIKQTPA